MTTLAPQLAFNGNCRTAFELYAELLGGTITVMNSFGGNDAPLPPGSTQGKDEAIRYAELQIGSTFLRGNDAGPEEFVPMQGFNISLHLDDAERARAIFDALAEGGKVTTAPAEVEWAKLFAMVTDRFGVPWLILAQEKGD